MKKCLVGFVVLPVILAVFAGIALPASRQVRSLASYPTNPFVIKMDIPAEDDGSGGIVVFDVNGDGLMDYLVTKPGHLAVYSNDGKKLWVKKVPIRVSVNSENRGLPGWHGPGVQAGDVDRDGRAEVVFLTEDSVLHIVDGATGKEEKTAKPPVPDGAERWEMVIIANLRGKGDSDLILQATNKEGYRMGRYLAAYAVENLNGPPLWQTDKYIGCAHNGARVADIDGDGRDDVLGVTIVDHNGRLYQTFKCGGHMDSVFAERILPGSKNLQVVMLKEGDGNHVYLFDKKKLYWYVCYDVEEEAQNAAIGDFDLSHPGLEIWCRSRYDVNQKPFVIGADGKLLARYELSAVAPRDWTNEGVEVIWSIHWTGGPKQLAAAKERHKSGDVCIFDPMTGRFVQRFKEKADRLYVADVTGDWREELVVLNGNELHIYQNKEPNPNPQRRRLWSEQHYRRSKMTWNYYSP